MKRVPAVILALLMAVLFTMPYYIIMLFDFSNLPDAIEHIKSMLTSNTIGMPGMNYILGLSGIGAAIGYMTAEKERTKLDLILVLIIPTFGLTVSFMLFTSITELFGSELAIIDVFVKNIKLAFTEYSDLASLLKNEIFWTVLLALLTYLKISGRESQKLNQEQ